MAESACVGLWPGGREAGRLLAPGPVTAPQPAGPAVLPGRAAFSDFCAGEAAEVVPVMCGPQSRLCVTVRSVVKSWCGRVLALCLGEHLRGFKAAAARPKGCAAWRPPVVAGSAPRALHTAGCLCGEPPGTARGLVPLASSACDWPSSAIGEVTLQIFGLFIRLGGRLVTERPGLRRPPLP